MFFFQGNHGAKDVLKGVFARLRGDARPAPVPITRIIEGGRDGDHIQKG
jgi:hypothetical protein